MTFCSTRIYAEFERFLTPSLIFNLYIQTTNSSWTKSIFPSTAPFLWRLILWKFKILWPVVNYTVLNFAILLKKRNSRIFSLTLLVLCPLQFSFNSTSNTRKSSNISFWECKMVSWQSIQRISTLIVIHIPMSKPHFISFWHRGIKEIEKLEPGEW